MAADVKTGRGTLTDYATVILERRKSGRVLIVLPFYLNYPSLFAHLELLSRQACRDFDLIIVANALSDEERILHFIDKAELGFGIILVKRKEDTGSAGGYFTGEKFALESGYGAIIHADDDCLPVDPSLIGNLVAKWEGGALAAGAECRFLHGGSEVYASKSTTYYGLVDCGRLRARGLHYVPMYIGADDLEFGYRVVHGLDVAWVDSHVTHPARHTIFADFNRSLLYRINAMLLVIPNRIEEYMYGFAGICPAYLIFGSSSARMGGAHLLRSVILHRFGKGALPELSVFEEPPPKSFDAIISSSREKKGAVHYDYSQVRGGFGRLPAFAASVNGKVVLLDLVQNYSVLLSMMLAKETWIESGRGTYLLARNSGPVQKIVKLGVFAIAMPFFLGAGIATFFINWARKPDTRGYGVK